jgi:hypothetical protein
MRIKCIESPNPSQAGQEFVMKHIDARFLEHPRKWFLGPFSVSAEINTVQRFVDMVCYGQADGFLKQVDKSLYGDCDWQTERHGPQIELRRYQLWKKETFVYRHFTSIAQRELDTYSRLQELQSTCIPKIICRLRTCPRTMVG